MLKVKVKKGRIDKALKQMKKKVRRTKQKDEIMKRQEFTKKSAIRRQEILKAIYKENKNREE